jgi:phosphoglucomutase
MAISPLAGKPATKEMLVDLTRLEREYHARLPTWMTSLNG